MRISELSEQTGVTTASIKYYVREGLLPAPERVGYNQSEYGTAHVARLRLIRSLLDVGGLSVSATREVLAAVDDEALPIARLMGTAQRSIPVPEGTPSRTAVDAIGRVGDSLGWHVHPSNPGILIAARVLEHYEALDLHELSALLEPFAAAADAVARAEVAIAVAVAAGDRDRMAAIVAVGTVLGDSLLAGLRRIAQESAAREARPDSTA
ncbi:MerR family transcriptional regulator [Agrococcus sp. ARC_14]|uniref:MerR family transcriptional regulator n=1 Tax=Agrococcus sp. ARC_14 TaxID=2919927 RepID=UPI001F063DB5|nr:MerR family transcriptional regulator [Agrococcus sp. ARC_14]MCH1883164.1 MerR family transcriptional regulator [Agrococcus sp. ARC_14]